MQLPRAICSSDGVPEKGSKSWATSVFKKLYPSCFLTQIPVTDSEVSTAYIIDGMFIINSSPLAIHRTFAEYAQFLFDIWVVRPRNQFNTSEVHLIFDDPNRHGISPKDIERSRRDSAPQISDFEEISAGSLLPSNWRSFLAVRKQKRLLVNFLSVEFLRIASQSIDFKFVTAGGFDGQHKDHARVSFNQSISDYPTAHGDHEEADTRVWLHCMTSSCDRIIIYSPDTDVYFIGLPLIRPANKSVFVQLKDSPYEKMLY